MSTVQSPIKDEQTIDRQPSVTSSTSTGQYDDKKLSQVSLKLTDEKCIHPRTLPSANADFDVRTNGWLSMGVRREYWDLVVVCCSFITATFSVFIFSFNGLITPKQTPVYFAVERILDIVFIIELIRNLLHTFKWFRDLDKATFRRKNIFRRKLGMIWWVLVDVMSAIPWDLIALALNSDNPSRRPLQVIRFLRMLHLFKLVRVMKMLRSKGTRFRKLEVNLGLKLAYYQLIRLIMSILLLSHICGCLFYFFGTVSKEDTSWITGAGLPDDDYSRYIASLYFSVYTITTIGYGDITPESSTERTYTTIIMLLGAACFAVTISQGHDISNKLLERNQEESKEMDAWTDLLHRYNVCSDLKIDIQRHIETTFFQHTLDYEYQLVKKLPNELRHRIQIQMHEDSIRCAKIFRNLKPQEIRNLCMSGIKELIVGNHCRLYNKTEKVDSIFLVTEREFTLGEDIYRTGDVVGIENAVSNSVSIADVIPESPSYARVLQIPWDAIREALKQSDPETLQSMEDERAKALWAKTLAEIKAKIKIHKGAQELRATVLGQGTNSERGLGPAIDSDESGDSDLSCSATDVLVTHMKREIQEKEDKIQELERRLRQISPES